MQLLIGIIFAMGLWGCSLSETNVEHYEVPKPDKNAKWFDVEERFVLRDLHGNLPLHPFFDYQHNANMQQSSIDFVMTTPADSSYGYSFDLLSGRNFRSFSYCRQNDIWGQYDGNLERPNFNDGFAPRLLDQLGLPQRVIVFGAKDYFAPFSHRKPALNRVRVVGGAVEQFCKNFPCTTRDKWLSRLILIAVQPTDPQFREVRTLSSLKKVVDWPYTKAFLENGKGRTFEGDKQVPAYRIVGGTGGKNALKFALNRGYLFEDKSINSLKKNCHKLYDFIWEFQKDIRKNALKTRMGSQQEEGSQVSEIVGNFRNVEIRPEKKVKRKNKDREARRSFALFMNLFYEKYINRYKTCQKFVRATSINKNRDRHWFFAFMDAFVKLEDSGHIYRCNRKAWIENPLLSNGKPMFSPKKERKSCTGVELDRAFDMTATVFSGLQRSHNGHYYYIQYDEGKGGTHQKLYSWVFHSGKRLSCYDRDKKELRAKDKLIFPQDINWKPFSTHQRKNLYDIIR